MRYYYRHFFILTLVFLGLTSHAQNAMSATPAYDITVVTPLPVKWLEPLEIAWNVPSERQGQYDWMGIYLRGEDGTVDVNSAAARYIYTLGQNAGSIVIDAPPGKGDYEIRYFHADDGSQPSSADYPVPVLTVGVVEADNPFYDIAIVPDPSSSYTTLQNITLNWSVPIERQGKFDWIGIYPKGTTDFSNSPSVFIGTAGEHIGSSTTHYPNLKTPGANGHYEVRYFFGGTNPPVQPSVVAYPVIELAVGVATLPPPPPQSDNPHHIEMLVVTPNQAQPSETITVHLTLSELPTNNMDQFVAIYKKGASNYSTQYGVINVTGTLVDHLPLTLPLDMEPGEYQVRYIAENFWMPFGVDGVVDFEVIAP